MTTRATLLPDGRRLVVDAVTAVLSLLLIALVLAAVLGPGPAELAGDTGLAAVYLVPAQIVQAVLGQLVLVRVVSRLRRTLAMLGIWAVVLAGLALGLPLLYSYDRVGSAGLVLPVGLALLAVVRGSVIGVLGFDSRVAVP